MVERLPMWDDRLEELDRDFQRIQSLLRDNHDLTVFEFEGRLSLMFNVLAGRFKEVRAAKANTDVPGLWKRLAQLDSECRDAARVTLEFLGGIAISRGGRLGGSGLDEGVVSRAQDWLDSIRSRVGLERKLAVTTGLGPIVAGTPTTKLGMSLVRVPFLDWDDWSLPLLGHGVGLLAAAQERRGDGKLGSVSDPRIDPRQRVSPPDERQRQYVDSIYADMWCAAILGPVYAIAVFVLGLDYVDPTRCAPVDPDQIDGQESAPRFLPSPADRASVILGTLRLLDEDNALHPYEAIARRLQELWHTAVEVSGQVDPLPTIQTRLAPWLRDIYCRVLVPPNPIQMEKTPEAWRNAQLWQGALTTTLSPPTQPIRAPNALTTDLLGAIWLCRLDYPDQADNIVSRACALGQGKPSVSPVTGTRATSPFQAVSQARLDRLKKRWERLIAILRNPEIRKTASPVVVGRFYRLLSERQYWQKKHQTELAGPNPPANVWQRIAGLEADGHPIQRQAITFLGGLLVRDEFLDHEPAQSELPECGPSICDLADRFLQELVTSTGVNWHPRTVLGLSPFLAEETDFIAIRFPDWSLGNLPALAHEFGHVVARDTPAFKEYLYNESCKAGREAGCGQGDAVFHQVESLVGEVFADVFATYTLGPAFAGDTILRRFNPAEAYLPRGSHPSHAERVKVILQVLDAMNQDFRTWAADPGPYRELINRIENIWDRSVQSAQVQPGDPVAYGQLTGRTTQWSTESYKILDQYYSLETKYTRARWNFARQQMTDELKAYRSNSFERLRSQALTANLGGLQVTDLLNAAWWSTWSPAKDQESAASLSSAALKLGQDYLKGYRDA